MATVGTLGDIPFFVSKKQTKTFDNMKWESSAQFASHNRHLKDTLLEFTGTDADKISFTVYFSVFLGINPFNEMTKLLNAERSGKVMKLIIGGKTYGKGKWVIASLSKDLERFDNPGNLLTAKVSVSLTAYADR